RPLARPLLGGAVRTLLSCIHSATAAGYTFPIHDESCRALLLGSWDHMLVEMHLSLNGRDGELTSRQLSSIATAVGDLRAQGLRFDRAEVKKAVEPLEVRLVSTPARQSTTTLTRDPTSGEIMGSRQLETDTV
ncbi:MAG: hypothetical protein K9K38_19465, partial [Rhodoferax sp.]|nr:hypothetical protein [Rhodoferax sp.]